MAIRIQSKNICFNIEKPISTIELSDLRELHFKGLKRLKSGNYSTGNINLLDIKNEIAKRLLKKCNYCVHNCLVNRHQEPGICRLSHEPLIAGEYIHLGEEPEISPTHAIFFSGCTMHCSYCHAWKDTFYLKKSKIQKVEELAELVSKRYRLQSYKSISFIGGTPEPHLHTIIQLSQLISSTVKVPLVFNSNATLSLEGLQLMEGVIDIYLPDFKHWSNQCAFRITGFSHYLEVIKSNLKAYEVQGAEILIRHLVLPEHLKCCTFPILKWLENNITTAKINILYQYRPLYHAKSVEQISRKLSKKEVKDVQLYATSLKNLKDRLIVF